MLVDLSILIARREQDPLPIQAYPASLAPLTAGNGSIRRLESLFRIEH